MIKQKIVTVIDDGHTYKFQVSRMPARKFEKWLVRAGLILASSASGISVPSLKGVDDIVNLAKKEGLNIFKNISFERVEPLYDELLDYVARVDGNSIEPLDPDLIDAYITEVGTLLTLRMEAFAINLDFSKAAKNSTSPAMESTARP